MAYPERPRQGTLSQFDLAAGILSSPKFDAIVSEVATSSVLRQFPAIERTANSQHLIDWSVALLCASAITENASEAAQDAALRVVQGCLLEGSPQSSHRQAAAVLLERMGNWPALRLAAERQLVESESWLAAPEPIKLDVVRRRLELRIQVSGNRSLAVNSFQRRFWTAALHNQWVSVSAPTSAGKSFVVKRWFEDRLAQAENMQCVYLVPTRALIEEVSRDFRTDDRFRNVGIFSLPWDPGINTSARSIQVLTQERLHILLQDSQTFRPSMLFVDEAQKFGDDARGILLQRVLRETADRNPELQVLLASPLSSNPELLLEDAPFDAACAALTSETVTVNQNLLWVNQEKHNTRSWRVQLVLNGVVKPVGRVDLSARPTTTSLRLSLVAATLGANNAGNVVYVNGAASAEKTAQQIYEALGAESDISADPDMIELRELVRSAIHRQYSLGAVLARGVAFHYGNMPLLVRTEVERLFRMGKIRYLVCTSTLLEGVNLPCTNIFVRGPRKGRGKIMTPADFWNLAGRAGRWGIEFQGNIVCIDTDQPDQWPEPPALRVSRPLRRATADALSEVDRLVRYIDNGTPLEESSEWPLGESIFSYLAEYVGRGVSLSSIPGLGLERATSEELEQSVGSALAQVTVPYSLYSRHAGISPLAMQRLLEFLSMQDDIRPFILVAPESFEAARTYANAMGIITRFLGDPFSKTPGRHMQLAILVVSWMRGIPLARLVQERVDYNRGREKPKPVGTIIRETMVDIEQIARFQAPKYLACYADILRLIPAAASIADDHFPDITMMLELGVSRTTDVSLMALGLSRTTVVLLSGYIVADSLSPDECATWLRETDLDSLEVPELVKREIREIVGIS